MDGDHCLTNRRRRGTMAKRTKQSGLLDDLFEIASSLPWWLDAAIAGGSLIALRHVAEATSTAAGTQSVDAGRLLSTTIWSTLAMVGQFIVPLVFLLGAVASIHGRARRRELVVKAASPTGSASTDAMSWQEFELVVGEVFRRRGYKVEERGGRGPDGGVDLIARRGSESVLVQCKQWRSKQVGVAVVRELLGSMTALGSTAGSVVTSGRFTAEARRFAADQGIDLIDGEALRSLARTPVPAAIGVTAAPEPQVFDESLSGRETMVSPPACPVCARGMVERTAGRGATIGSKFWGCPAFPGCRGTRRS